MSSASNNSVIKYKFNLKMSSPINEEHFLELEKWRSIFHKMNLIGEYRTTKVGYGNLSKRILPNEESFIITGAGTGGYAHLSGMQYTKVTKCNLPKLTIEAVGPIAPDDETLTHHAIYLNNPHIHFIYHIHNIQLWNYMLKSGLDNTDEEVDHRSLDFSNAAKVIIQNKKQGIFALSDLEGGVIAYADTAENAGKIILETLKSSRN